MARNDRVDDDRGDRRGGWWRAVMRWLSALGDAQTAIPCPQCRAPIAVHLRRGRQPAVTIEQACACQLTDDERQAVEQAGVEDMVQSEAW